MKHEYRWHDEGREIFPGVTQRIMSWGWIFDGSREALIAAELVKPEMFPGEPVQRKTRGRGTYDGRMIRIFPRPKKSFAVWCSATEEEERRYWEYHNALGMSEGKSLPNLSVFEEVKQRNPFLMSGIVRRYEQGTISCAEAFQRACVWLDRTVHGMERAA